MYTPWKSSLIKFLSRVLQKQKIGNRILWIIKQLLDKNNDSVTSKNMRSETFTTYGRWVRSEGWLSLVLSILFIIAGTLTTHQNHLYIVNSFYNGGRSSKGLINLLWLEWKIAPESLMINTVVIYKVRSMKIFSLVNHHKRRIQYKLWPNRNQVWLDSIFN